jgi:hypothetical protein
MKIPGLFLCPTSEEKSPAPSPDATIRACDSTFLELCQSV